MAKKAKRVGTIKEIESNLLLSLNKAIEKGDKDGAELAAKSLMAMLSVSPSQLERKLRKKLLALLNIL